MHIIARGSHESGSSSGQIIGAEIHCYTLTIKQMAVKVIRFSPAVNNSEMVAEQRTKSALISLNDVGDWIVFAGYSSASSPLHQADDLDLVLIGPRGIYAVEVKHWNASWITTHSIVVEAEADKLTAKARRLAGRVKHALSNAPRVTQTFLVTDETGSGAFPKTIRGVPIWTLRDLHKVLKALPPEVMHNSHVPILAEGLEPSAKLHVTGKVRKISHYQNLELLTQASSGFHRIFKGVHQRTKEKVVLHIYDYSACEQKKPAALAERESRTLQVLQRSRYIPRVRDTLRELPEFPGEIAYFTMIDPGAPLLKNRANDVHWTTNERIEFAANCCHALNEVHELPYADAPRIVHRNLTPSSILVGPENAPFFINFQFAHISTTQTLGITTHAPTCYDAPEVSNGDLGAASQSSDVYSLCASLLTLFPDSGDNSEVREILQEGCNATPTARLPLKDIEDKLRALLGPVRSTKQESNQVAVDHDLPASDYWSAGQLLPFRDMTLRVVCRLGSGGVGRTFKVEQVDQASGENFGTFVAKVMKSQESGSAALQAYQRVRAHTTAPGLSVVFETASEWGQDRVVALLKWVEGDSLDGLAGLLPIAAEESGYESVEELLIRWCTDVCAALSMLHSRGLVHGDVSPRNLIRDRGCLTLTDYDLVTPVNQVAWGAGASAYSSPEAQRREPLTFSDDIFALAASLFEVAFDRTPFPSPNGPLDKAGGLDWGDGEKDSLPRMASFLDKATSPDKAFRFSDASSALSYWSQLTAGSSEEVPTPDLPTPVQRTKQVVPWLESLLRIYPGSPHGNIETRGLDSDFALATYVDSELEEALFRSVIGRSTRLVLLCGNAGDGKTALLQHLAGRFGIQRHQSANRVWEATTKDGLLLRANLDGSASWNGKSANALLDEFLNPFLDGEPSEDIAHFIAINDGRLYEWLEASEKASAPTPFTKALRSFLANDDINGLDGLPHVRFISLNHRSLVGGRTNENKWSDEFLDRLITRLLGGEQASDTWAPCLSCEAWERCTAGPNAHRLLASDGSEWDRLGATIRHRISEALQAVHQRGQVHITTRELRGALSYVLFGVTSCKELHDDSARFATSSWDMLFSPDSPYRQGELLRELSALDPALEAHPQLDRWLLGRTARDVVGAGPSYPSLSRDSARRRAYLEWSDSQIEAIAGDNLALPLANGEHLRLFKEAALRSAEENKTLCARVCRGISQLESLPTLALTQQDSVPMRISPRTPTESCFWVEKPIDRFRLEAEWPAIHDIPLAVLPRRLKLIYRTADGRDDVLSMGYELFHTLLLLASGEQLSALRSDDLFANLAIFTQRLAQEDEGHLLAWNPKSEGRVYRLSIRSKEDTLVLACEPIELNQ